MDIKKVVENVWKCAKLKETAKIKINKNQKKVWLNEMKKRNPALASSNKNIESQGCFLYKKITMKNGYL